MKLHTKYVFGLSLLLILAVGIFFRVWGMPDRMMFFGDQGIDLLVATRIVRGEFFPVIGPELSVTGYLNPPTYYYLLAAILKVTGSEVGAVWMFAALNVIAGLLFADVIRKKTDVSTALMFLFLYMVVHSSVEQGRAIWNPYLPTVFFAASFWFLTSVHPSVWRYIVGVVCYVVGASIYPTGILLLPVYLYYGNTHLSRIYFHGDYPKWFNVLTFGWMFEIICLPYVIYEAKYGFPTLRAIFQPDLSKAPRAWISLFPAPESFISQSVGALNNFADALFPFQHLSRPLLNVEDEIVIGLVATIMLVVFSVRRTLRAKKVRAQWSYLGVPYVVIGFLPMLFVASQVNEASHRHLVFVPYVLMVVAHYFLLIWRFASFWMRGLAVIALVVFVFTNLTANIAAGLFTYRPYVQAYGPLSRVYEYIKNREEFRNADKHRIDFHILSPGDVWNYEVMPLWYFLRRDYDYPVPMNTMGNGTNRKATVDPKANISYVLCFPARLMKRICWSRFASVNPDMEIVFEKDLNPYYVYVTKRSVK